MAPDDASKTSAETMAPVSNVSQPSNSHDIACNLRSVKEDEVVTDDEVEAQGAEQNYVRVDSVLYRWAEADEIVTDDKFGAWEEQTASNTTAPNTKLTTDIPEHLILKDSIYTFNGFPRASQNLPANMTLEQIAWYYPNHLQGHVLKRFADAGWSGRKILQALNGNAAHQISHNSQPWSFLQKRLAMLDPVKHAATKQYDKSRRSRRNQKDDAQDLVADPVEEDDEFALLRGLIAKDTIE